MNISEITDNQPLLAISAHYCESDVITDMGGFAHLDLPGAIIPVADLSGNRAFIFAAGDTATPLATYHTLAAALAACGFLGGGPVPSLAAIPAADLRVLYIAAPGMAPGGYTSGLLYRLHAL